MFPDSSKGPRTHRTASSTPQTRPCLPQVERLGDRVMLSVSTEAIITDVEADEILVALVMGQLPIVSGQLAALKLGASLVGTDQALKVDYIKLTDAFLKLQDTIYDFGDVLIKADHKLGFEQYDFARELSKASLAVTDQLSKIDALAFSWGLESGKNPMLPAVQKIETNTLSLLNILQNKFAPDGGTTHEELLNILKLSDDFLKIDQDVIKIGSDLLIGKKVSPGSENYLQIKFQDILVTSYKIGDDALQQTLIGLQGQTLDLLKFAGGDGQIG